MTINDLRKKLILQLTQYVESPQLDVDLILMHVLKKSRTQLLMSLNETLFESVWSFFELGAGNRDLFPLEKWAIRGPIPIPEGNRRTAKDLITITKLKKTHSALKNNINNSELRFEADQQKLNDFISRRINGEPIAYILGFQPFWTMELIVTPNVLIPRPETECLVEWVLKQLSDKNNYQVADLGTGSGAIAIALAIEKPRWKIDATDQSSKALYIASQNAKKYNVKNISFLESDWFDALSNKKYDLIISNPPYIAQNDAHLEKLNFEPQSALISGKKGLDAIEKITQQATRYLKSGGYLVIEHGYDQADTVFKLFETVGFIQIENHCDLSGTPRFVTGIKS